MINEAPEAREGKRAVSVAGHRRDATAIHGRVTKIFRALCARETKLCLQIEVAQ